MTLEKIKEAATEALEIFRKYERAFDKIEAELEQLEKKRDKMLEEMQAADLKQSKLQQKYLEAEKKSKGETK